MHFVSISCGGEYCSHCGRPAMHKVGEEIMHDDPMPNRHNFTQYVCCAVFRALFRNVECDEASAWPDAWLRPEKEKKSAEIA